MRFRERLFTESGRTGGCGTPVKRFVAGAAQSPDLARGFAPETRVARALRRRTAMKLGEPGRLRALVRASNIALALAIALSSSDADAADREIEGSVVAQDGADLIVDLGAVKGARGGDVLEVWRPLRVKHPITGKVIVDRFRIGALKLGQVRPTLALARPEGAMDRAPALGDLVVLHREAPEPHVPTDVKRPPPSTPSADAPCFADPEAADLSALFESLRGWSPTARATRYEAFAIEHPHSRFLDVLREEARSLRGVAAAVATRAPELRGSFSRAEVAVAGASLRVAIELTGGAAGAVLHVRKTTDVAYTSLPFARVGDEYFAVTIPAETMTAPGVAYFVEATLPDGTARPIVGAANAPVLLAVEETPRPAPPAGIGYAASLWTDYALWTTSPSFGKANDRVLQTEGQLAMRYGDIGVRAVRSGFGVFRGTGGTLADLDDPRSTRAPRSVGLTYGHLELEWGLSESTSLLGRVVVGLRDDGIGGGGQAFVRLGNDRKTNLAIGGEILGGIGMRGIVQLEWRTIPRFPILLRTEVTNQPAGVAAARSSDPLAQSVSEGQGEVGARAIAQLGYRVTPSLEVALRASYQGRTITHAGPGAGAAVTIEW